MMIKDRTTTDSQAKDNISLDRFPIDQLLHPAAFAHPVSKPRILETHISWIVLTGDFAYKIKKPVHYDFVDYSTLELRRVNCLKELKLNQRYSTGIYLDVVPLFSQDGQIVVGSSSDASVDANNSPIEYAVKMREFEQESILSNQLKHSQLAAQQMDSFAESVAKFHRLEPPVVVDDVEVELDKLHHEVSDNFEVLRQSLNNTSQASSLASIEIWSEERFALLHDEIQERILQGSLKKCHGDLHLNNIIRFNGELVPFDGIEFNEHLQTIDTLNEVAFLFMDLMAHGYDRHAWRFLNAYLEIAGGYPHLELFRFFTVYRAMVRAKVAWINDQANSSSTEHPPTWLKGQVTSKDSTRREPVHPWDHYLEYAERSIDKAEPRLFITFGFSGSGKSTMALQAVEKGALRIRSDNKRVQLKQDVAPGELYSTANSDLIYREMLEEARKVIQAGYSVVADATFLSRRYRNWFQQLANELGAPFRILACDADYEILCSRIRERTGDPSEATVEVLRQQMDRFDPLDENEQKLTLRTP